MTPRVAWLLVLVGLLLIAAGCAHPLEAAVETSNAAARSLKWTGAAMSAAYKDEQIAAAKRVEGDRADPSVKAQQRDRVEQVRKRWADAWAGYRAARSAWVALAASLEIAIQLEATEPDYGAIVGAVQEMAATLRELAIVAEPLIGLQGAPPGDTP